MLVSVDATSKKRAFEASRPAVREPARASRRATVTDNLFARERLGSTGLGHGVAIPHGRIKGLKSPLAAVLRWQQPIAFDAPDDEPVGLLIFLLVPEAATQRHLEILSEIAEMLSATRRCASGSRPSPTPPQLHAADRTDWQSAQTLALTPRRASGRQRMKPTVISAEALFEEYRGSCSWEWVAGHAHPERHFDDAAVARRAVGRRPGRLPQLHPPVPRADRRRSARSPT